MAPQDSFIEEEEDVCPLCIEEFDLSDRNFRPCPCGYQVCQFCFNNIKNNMNGLCPACRRPYDEKTIQWKVVTTEEVAEFRANIQKNQRKRVQEQRQKEAQKREAEKENRKNLIGVRVVQKNLVYITGLAPTVREDELLKTLRKPEFFGQYGAIQKISISNRKSSDGQHHSLGIYVTFEKPEEATRCIQAVHGSQNGDRILKAQYGTTKYCSAWLKNEKCNNPGCMFLHEQGDEEDSYTRQDLSSMNGIHTQRPLPSGNNGSFRTTPRQQVSQPTLTSMSQPMARSSSKDGSDYGLDGSALPSSANWARNPQRSRRGSHATSGAPSSPAVSASLPTTTEVAQEAVEDTETSSPASRPLEDDKASSKDPTEESQELPPKSSLATILHALQNCTFSSFVTPQANELDPPLFDIRGGEKRKAMREDDDARISGDQKNAAEGQVHSESEAETGGSLALGGEPEERDMAGDGQAFEHRHISTFPPIQRSNADTLFGPALSGSNFNPGTNQMGRGINPQQLISLRPQSGFGEQVPSNLSGQTTFPSQGHNRQSSRFSFMADSPPAATNLKFTANPRVMGQQSSMLPASLQSSGNSHFFGSSMPAPPPGLKSTNTPPNVFGQGFGGSAFGTATKDSSGDLLQSLIGRSRGGGSQPHDGGKREYMISSFSNQYPPPSTSTPAPTSGLLASLYGNHPGAFQDFGSKQKKKGKKHRHANTSSSGGSGLVDLADPSILQARMQHQSQSNTGVNQGVFSGQSQDNDFQLSDEAKLSVDALVSDDSSPTVTNAEPRFHQTSYLSISEVPNPIDIQIQGQLQSAQVPLAMRPVPPPGLVNEPILSKKTAPQSNVLDQDVDLRTKSNAAKDPVPAAVIGSWPAPTKGPILEDEDFPALGTPRLNEALGAGTGSISAKAAMLKAVPSAKKSHENFSESPREDQRDGLYTEFQSTKGSQLKSLTQSAPNSGATLFQPKEGAEGLDEFAETSRFPPLPTPSGAGSATVITSSRGMPKTLRVVPSSIKIEARSASPSPAPISSAVSAPAKPGNSHRPGTPASEMISDTASITSVSVSISRAGSPPLTKIGSAPVRGTTKSQQRKQRKDVLKQETKILAETPKTETTEHAPVIGRKKKQKKEKTPKEANASSSAATPIEPPREEMETHSKGNRKPTTDDNHLGDSKIEGTRYSHGGTPSSGSSEKEIQETATALPVSSLPGTSESADKALERPQSSPASVFADIKESLWTAAIDKLQLLKPVSSISSRLDNNASNTIGKKEDCKECSCRCGEMQDADLAALRAGRPVRKQFHTDGSRMLITPHGDCIRGLTPEEEDTFLALQTAIAATAENPAAFVAPRHQPSSGAFSLIKGRAVPNGRPNIFPSTVQPQSQDPIGKLQREDALSYINQYVLPRLSLGATSMGFPKGASSTRDTASLNSLAPYFYGPDAAAGVGIYSTPESARAIQDFAAPGMSLDEISKGAAASSIGNMPLMSVEDAEAALIAAKRETEKLEKGLNSVIKRNRRLLLGA
ncbi:CCR4-NOT transcription complex subunit 4 [Trichoderma gamsii]|uniref:CCR4-NOT transcription complex subunit 4 n=1 Tax=Trichoderma gamsii TaxID=398673 RepID=A0A2P4ZH95_9HYPO|nr:CCR4-NOT transcription complex subunit 4 [Trichoderma gamsii]PON23659.1 CCR4-NOT transcription complex subunit 4 [Trichoderma gamsii]